MSISQWGHNIIIFFIQKTPPYEFSKCSNRSQKILLEIHIFNDSGNFILIRTSVGMIEQNYHAMKSIFVQLYMWQNANRILIVLLKCILKEFSSSNLMHMHTHLINYSIHVQCLYFHKVWYFHFFKGILLSCDEMCKRMIR